MKFGFLVLLAACESMPMSSSTTSALTGTSDCIAPTDRPTLQAALDAGGVVRLCPGVFLLDRARNGSYNRFASLSTHGHNVSLIGSGPDTVLELHGSQGHQSVALISIDPSAEHIRISDLTVRCRADSDDPCIDTDEQTHGIVTSAICAKTTSGSGTCNPIRDVEITRVNCDWPRDTADRKGDCVRLLGGSAPVAATSTTPEIYDTQVYGVRLVGNYLDAARSAVMIQRGVYDAVLMGNTFRAVKTCVDGEASGGGFDGRLSITANNFLPGCSPALSLTNTNDATVAGNTLESITVYRSKNVTIHGNALTQTAKGDTGTIDASNACDGLIIADNPITRLGFAGPAIKITPHSGTLCNGLDIHDNAITQGTVAPAIQLESPSRVNISHNNILYTVPAPGHASIYIRTVSGMASAISISHNVISGPVTYGVTLDGSPGTFGRGISVVGNISDSTVFGLRLNNQQGFTLPITSNSNAMGPSAYGTGSVQVNAGE